MRFVVLAEIFTFGDNKMVHVNIVYGTCFFFRMAYLKGKSGTDLY